MAYLLLALKMLSDSTNTVLSKRFSRRMNTDFLHFIEYNLINAVFAAIFLFAINGFSFSMNGATLAYSFAYAGVVVLSVSLNVLTLRRVSVYLTGLTSTLGSLVISTFFGVIVLADDVTVKGMISLALMVVAVILPYIEHFKGIGKSGILVPVLYFIIGGAANVVTKLFTLDTRVTDSRSFFVMTNIIIAAIALSVLSAMLISKPKSAKDVLHAFAPRDVANILSRTALSNISSVLGIIVIAGMTLGVYTVTTSSFGIISGALLSLIVFREGINRATFISVVLAIASVIVSVL